MGNYSILQMFENPRRGRQARNFTTNVPKILGLKSSSEQILSENCRWVPLLEQGIRKLAPVVQYVDMFWMQKLHWLLLSGDMNYFIFLSARIVLLTFTIYKSCKFILSSFLSNLPFDFAYGYCMIMSFKQYKPFIHIIHDEQHLS